MAIIKKSIKKHEPLTAEQIKEIEQASASPTDDMPELTAEQLREIAAIAASRRAARRKPAVTLRISAATLEKAKATGKGYTGFMSRLLDVAINSPEIVKKCL